MTGQSESKPVVREAFGAVWFARGSPASEQFAALSIQEQAKLQNRFRSVVASPRRVDFTKFRMIHGADGIYEFKVANPPLRALAFREGRGAGVKWYVTQILTKPKDILPHAQKAAAYRELHRRLEGHGDE